MEYKCKYMYVFVYVFIPEMDGYRYGYTQPQILTSNVESSKTLLRNKRIKLWIGYCEKTNL